jgi:hypothetical protein
VERTASSTTAEGRLVAFLRDATPARRREWLAGLSPEERAAVALMVERIAADPWSQYREDPIGFVEKGLCETLWSKQREILLSVRDNKRTAVPACHAPGKSHLAARIVAWWTMTNPIGTSQVVTTATTFRQVRNILWSHIRTLHAKHQLDGDCLTTEWKRNNSVVAFGFAPAQYNETALQGIHAPNLLIVVDEAGGISDAIGTAIEALMTGEHTRLLLLGNPPTDTNNSWFERTCNSHLYNTIRISAYDTPNFTNEPTGPCQTCPPTVKTHDIATHLVDKQWVNDIISELGEQSPFAQARIQLRPKHHQPNHPHHMDRRSTTQRQPRTKPQHPPRSRHSLRRRRRVRHRPHRRLPRPNHPHQQRRRQRQRRHRRPNHPQTHPRRRSNFT